MTEPIKIERGKPLPKSRGRYPFAAMKVGDSFFLSDRGIRGGLYGAAARHGIKISVRDEDDGIRIWRIE